MQASHVISDLVLALSAAGVWLYSFASRRKLRWLWGVFLISIALAALFGAARFVALHPMMFPISQFFQHAASSLGACGLALGALWLVLDVKSDRTVRQLEFACLLTGLVIFTLGHFMHWSSVFEIAPLIAMLHVLAIGLAAIFKGPSTSLRKVGTGLSLAVLLSALAMVALQALTKPWSIDAYHYLLAASMMTFGWSARRSTVVGNKAQSIDAKS